MPAGIWCCRVLPKPVVPVRRAECSRVMPRLRQITTLYDEYFPAERARPLTVVPYYEGDYWPGIAEEFIAKANDDAGAEESKGDGDVNMGKPGHGKPKKAKKAKSKSKRGKAKGKAKGKGRPRKKPLGRQPGDPGYDEVYEEVAKLLKTMRPDFMVAKLRPTCAICDKCVPPRPPLRVIVSVRSSHADASRCRSSCRRFVDGAKRYHCTDCAVVGKLYDMCPDCHAQHSGKHEHELQERDQTPVVRGGPGARGHAGCCSRLAHPCPTSLCVRAVWEPAREHEGYGSGDGQRLL